MIKSIEVLRRTTDIYDNNVDVRVELVDGSTFIPTFFTLKNVKTLMSNWKKSGEYDFGSHFWMHDGVIVDCLDDETIFRVVNYLFDSGEIYRFDNHS